MTKSAAGNAVHAFSGDDALGDSDAVDVAERIRTGAISAREAADAALARLAQVNPALDAMALVDAAHARSSSARAMPGVLSGVPSMVKDNTDLAGLPTRHGSDAVPERAAASDAAFARQYRSLGFTLIGKTRLPEFGFNGSTEFADAPPVRNPWHVDHTPGGSSGGSAALVAAGVVPIAHANDGGGSIRIPAACCGLVGLKPSRGRLVANATGRQLPIDIVCDGVVTRSVRDTAAFFAGAEHHYRNPSLPPMGHVIHPGAERLRVGLVLDSMTGVATDAATREAVTAMAQRLEALGHIVSPLPLPADHHFTEDFSDYWGMLAYLVTRFGRHSLHPDFDPSRVDGLTRGLRARFNRRFWRAPMFLTRLRGAARAWQRVMRDCDVVLSPVLGHVPPALGALSPQRDFDVLFDALRAFVAFTPLNNVNGSPAIALPAGLSPQGLPIGAQLAAGYGQERRLLEIALALEQQQPWPRIQDYAASQSGDDADR